MNRLIPLLFLVMPLAPVLSAQDSCPCTFHGTVVDSVTGAPIRGALVESNLGSPNATLTDSDGSFHFDGLPAGSISISVTKPGFLLGNPFVRQFLPFPVAPGADPVVVKLVPTGVVTGRVADERDEPLENFHIELFRRAPGDNVLFRFNSKQILTNDLGVFRIPDLTPGSYFLLVSPFNPQTYTSPGDETPFGYPRVYYPGVSDSSSATALKVLAGRETRANLTLSAKPAIRLSGTVTGNSPGSSVQVSIHPESGPVTVDQRTGSFQTGWVHPGVYNLYAESSEPQSQPTIQFNGIQLNTMRTASQTVTATTSLSGIHLLLLPVVSIPVKVHGLPQNIVQVIIYAHSKETGKSGQAIGPIKELNDIAATDNDTYSFFLSAGKYQLELSTYGNDPYYVESATFGSTDLLSQDLIVDSSAARSSIDIVFRKGAATLSGSVAMKDSSHGAYVCLFSPSSRSTPTFQSVETNGSFKFDHLSPGTYRLAAFDGLIDPDFSNQELLKKLSAIAKEISLVPEQSLSVSLDLDAVQE